MREVITLWGMVKYQPTILKELDLPEGMSEETMGDYIYMYAGENETRYSDPDILERLVHTWFTSRKTDFQYMWDALHAEYNPIENYDRHDDFTEEIDSTTNRESNVKTTQEGEANTEDSSTTTPGRTTEEQVSAFDSGSYQPSKKIAESGTESSEGTSHGTNSSTTTGEGTEKSVLDHTKKNTGRSHGNIGVTTNQQMIESELQLRRFNLYKTIALEFEDEFTIPVYGRRCDCIC